MFRFVALFLLAFASLPSPGEMQGNGDLRLAGKCKDKDDCGRLEVFLNGTWGTVCGPIPVSKEEIANTACRQLGYLFSVFFGSVALLQVPEANESMPILLDIDSCITDGKPNHILRCSYSVPGPNDCSHQFDAAIQCGEKETIFYDTEVRLSNGTWPSTGVLEVYVESKRQWGTVCSSNFNQAAADSACRQLGYTNAMGYTGVNKPLGSTVWASSAKCSKSNPCFNSCFNYPSSSVSQCSGDGKVVFLNCTFNVNISDSSTAGSELDCTYVPGPPNTTHYYWIGVGVGAVVVVVFLIVFVVVGTIVLFKLKSKRTHYVQVNSYGDVKD